METSFIPLCAIIAVLIIAFLFASLPQVSHKMRYKVLYAIAIILLLAVIPISEYLLNDWLVIGPFCLLLNYDCLPCTLACLLNLFPFQSLNITMPQSSENREQERTFQNIILARSINQHLHFIHGKRNTRFLYVCYSLYFRTYINSEIFINECLFQSSFEYREISRCRVL